MSSAWDIKLQSFPKLKESIKADILIIGAGLAGIWHAYLLSKKGKKVVVVEKKKIANGATYLTTAFLNEEIDTNLADLVSMFGKKIATEVWKSHEEAINLVDETQAKENIDCDFERASLYTYASDDGEFKILQEEFETASELGFTTFLKRNNDLSFKNCGSWEIPNQAKYHPLKFIRGLIDVCVNQGVIFYENTEVTKISGKDNLKVETKDGKVIKASKVVICTYKPFNNESTHFKKGMYVSYVLQSEIPRGRIPSAMFLDMKDPYNYFRVDNIDESKDRIIFGGADHRAEIKISKEKNFKALEETMKELFKGIPLKTTNRWSGPILEPTDGLALVGEIAPNQYVATAFSGNGMTYSPLSAMINTDLILGKKNKWSKIYDPKRPMKVRPLLKKAADYTKEFFGGAVKNIFK